MSKFSKICITLTAIAMIMSLASSANAVVVEHIIAIVNGDIVTQTDLEQRMEAKGLKDAGPISKETNRRATLDELIKEKILLQAIDGANIEVTDEEMARAVRNVLAQNGMTLPQLRSEIAKKGMTYDEYQEQLKNEIKKVKFVNQVISTEIKVTERDLRDHFERNKATLHGGKEAHLAEIVLPIAGITTESEAYALRDKAYDIVRQARENSKAFAKLAKEYSQGPNAEQGGDLGMIPIADLPNRVGEVARSMPEGAVSDPIPTENAIIIVKVIAWPDVTEGDFERVRDTIYQRIHQERLKEALDSYIQRRRQHAYIEIR